MTAFSNDLEGQIVDYFLRNQAVTQPAAVYLALFTADPTDAGTGPEASFTGYARQAVTWGALSAGVTRNTNTVTFPANGGSTATITHMAIYSALTGGTMLFHGPLAVNRTLNNGDILSFAANALEITLD